MDKTLLKNMYSLHNETISKFALSYCYEKELAEDAVSYAFGELSKMEDNEINNIPGWLTTVAKNYIIREHKRKKKQQGYLNGQLEKRTSARKPPIRERFLDKYPNNTRLQYCLQKLKPNQRKMIELYYFKGKKCKDIALATNKSLSNIKTTLSRARKRLDAVYNN